jgi:hypothetical protein
MIKIISKLSVVSSIFVLPVCFAATSESPMAPIHGSEYSITAAHSAQSASERLMLASNDEDRAKAAKDKQDKQKEKEELKKKQMAERNAKQEQKKKEMAEHKAKEEQKRKEKAEHKEKEKHGDRAEHRDRDKHRGRDEHRDRSKAAGNNAPPTAAPAIAPAAAPKQELSAPPKAAPAPAPAAAPKQPLVVRTYPASGVNAKGATLNGYASYPGKVVRVWFEWGDSPSFGQATAAQSFNGEKSVAQAAWTPARGKKYYYRTVAESSGLLVYGETSTFVVP